MVETARPEQEDAGAPLEELWRESVRRHHERIRRELRAAWYGHYRTMADNHRAISEDYERRAEELCEG